MFFLMISLLWQFSRCIWKGLRPGWTPPFLRSGLPVALYPSDVPSCRSKIFLSRERLFTSAAQHL